MQNESLVESQDRAGQAKEYPVLAYMQSKGIRQTRANYLALNWPDQPMGPEAEQDAEVEAALPPQFRHPSWTSEE